VTVVRTGAPPEVAPAAQLSRRVVVLGPVVAVVTLLAALVATDAAGVSVRDPAHGAYERLVMTAILVAGLAVLDILIAATRTARRPIPTLGALRRARQTRWTVARVGVVGVALVSFYATHMAYRNLKSVVPLLRPGDLFDRQLGALDRTLFLGHRPGVVLHSLLGTDLSAHALSAVYMLYFASIPVLLALALVFAPHPAGVVYAAALALNCALGAAGYFLLPSIGPFHTDPGVFAGLPATPAGHLQDVLIHRRSVYLLDHSGPRAFQGIGAFPSLHVSIWFTSALSAHVFRLPRLIRAVLWALTALTAVATIYFGWHFLLDDVGGAAIAVASVGLALALTGFRVGRPLPRLRTPTAEAA
jgi:membrane-associated phospholipid phosphatase